VFGLPNSAGGHRCLSSLDTQPRAACNHVHVASRPHVGKNRRKSISICYFLLIYGHHKNGGRLPALLPSLSSFSSPFKLVKFSNTHPFCRYRPFSTYLSLEPRPLLLVAEQVSPYKVHRSSAHSIPLLLSHPFLVVLSSSHPLSHLSPSHPLVLL
jgi:hypothetical protein